MKALTNILNYILLLMMILIASCTEDAAEVDDLVRQEEYVSVRINVPGMKAANTRATADDNITSIVALVFREDKLISKTEVTNLTTITSTTGTFNLPRPKSGDVIHFLANVPSDVTLSANMGGSQTEVLCGLETRVRELSYWGKHEYIGDNINVILYRNMAMIAIEPDPDDECTFPEDELFIAGFINANQCGKLVPYDEETGYNEETGLYEATGFNFNLNTNDDHTLPTEPDPLAETDSLTNYGNGYDSSYYVFEHDNPKTEDGLYVICKIGKYFYKVALTSDGVNPYKIIRNHKYTIYVHDLDDEEGARYYKDVLDAPPINLKVIETTDLLFTYTENPTVYLNGGKNATLPVQITVPQDASLTEFNITTTNFTVTSSNGGTLTETQSGYSYAGGSTTFTFTPKSGLAADTYPITLSGSGNYLHAFTETIPVTVDATMMAVTTANDSDATLDMDDGDTGVTLVLTQPGNVDNVEVSVSADVFNVANTDNEYTFTPKDNNIAAGNYTVTFADSNYPQVSTTTTITVVNTPKVTFTEKGDKTIRLNGDPLSVTMDVPKDKTLSEFGIKITPATGLNVAQGENQLPLTEGVYTTTSGVSGPNTFTFTPTATGDYTITFSGSGEGVNMPQESERTINLTVNAAAVTTMSVTAVNGDSTIDLDSGDTNVTFTLTKPSGLQNVSVNITNANGSKANSYFTINANNADLYYDQHNDNFNNITDNNNTENIPITFTVKDNSIPGGEYTATFTGNYNGQNITATATITIVNTPTVSFSNTGKQTLYWNGGTNPTTFKVEMTNIPTDGSVTLSIKAADFEVSVTEGTITDSDGTYTYYTGGNTTFTFTPTNHGTNKSITITGSGTKVKVPSLEPIIVDVKNENAPNGYVVYGPEHNASETGIDFGNHKEYGLLGTNGNVDQVLIQYFKAGATLVIEFSNVRDGASMKLQSWWSNVYKSFDLTSSNDNTYTFKATDFTGGTFSNAQDYINNSGAGLCLVGVKVTITKITIIPAPTTNN